MSIRQIDHNYHVAGQITPDNVAALKEAGYTSIVCMRPDQEGGSSQPTFASIKAEAEKLGMSCHYLPMTPGSMPMEQAAKFKTILKQAKGPVFGYCASGNRAASLYQLAMQAGI